MGCGASAVGPVLSASASQEPAIVVADAEEWAALVSAGQKSYDAACGTCHPGGEADLGPALKQRDQFVHVMTKQIREGSGRMRPIGPEQLPESEMKGLMVYMKTMNAVGDVKGPEGT